MEQIPTTLRITKDLLEGSSFHSNVGQEFIYVTADKVRLCLNDHREALASQRAWVAPASSLVTSSAALAAAQFRDFVLKAATWEAVFFLLVIASAVWLVRETLSAIANRDKTSTEHVVSKLKAAGLIATKKSTAKVQTADPTKTKLTF